MFIFTYSFYNNHALTYLSLIITISCCHNKNEWKLGFILYYFLPYDSVVLRGLTIYKFPAFLNEF